MNGQVIGNIENADSLLDDAFTILSDDFTRDEIDRLFNILEAIAHELRAAKDELLIPDWERAQ
ncbi:unnamed protein product [marine sediment metagenome]|uniref:Uncharacterized protein n=1 Tax=marine sediment metagenome TaxID=412755 RepID=X1AQT7_9ZZZZ